MDNGHTKITQNDQWRSVAVVKVEVCVHKPSHRYFGRIVHVDTGAVLWMSPYYNRRGDAIDAVKRYCESRGGKCKIK